MTDSNLAALLAGVEAALEQHKAGRLGPTNVSRVLLDVIHGLRAALAAAKPSPTGRDEHPEATCERCHRPNVWSWHAPSPLWNAVMRDPETGADEWSIVCPPCFAEMAELKGLGDGVFDGRPRWIWHFGPEGVDVTPLWEDRDGRVWSSEDCLWIEPPAALAPAAAPTEPS